MMWIARLPPADETRLRSHEFQVCLVSQSFGFGDRELAFVDFSRSQRGRGGHESWGRCSMFFGFCLIAPKEFSHGAQLSAPIVMRRPRNWCRVVGV